MALADPPQGADGTGRARRGRAHRARASVDIAGRTMPLEVTWNLRARRYTLRLDPRTGGAHLTLPAHADLDDAISFLRRHERWLDGERGRLAGPVAFADGLVMPLRGLPHLIRHAGGRRAVRLAEAGPGDGADGVIWVGGPPDHLARRLTGWLRSQAKSDLTASADIHAGRLGLAARRVGVRDQRSRWGSCARTGALSFSWRLVLAPPFVLDYVAAHEVAHLKEMNHGARFWTLVRRLCPRSEEARTWLTANGADLHRYGTGPGRAGTG